VPAVGAYLGGSRVRLIGNFFLWNSMCVIANKWQARGPIRITVPWPPPFVNVPTSKVLFSCSFLYPRSFPSPPYWIMQLNFLLITLLFALSAAALTSDSEIFNDGSVEIAPAIEADAQSTPTRRSTNSTRRRRRHCAYPLPILSSAFTYITILFYSEPPCSLRQHWHSCCFWPLRFCLNVRPWTRHPSLSAAHYVLFIYLLSSKGVIKVHATADGSLQGYISQKFNPLNLYTLTTSLNDALMFLLPTAPTQHFNTAMDISSLAGPSATSPLLGSVGSSEFGTGQSGFSYLAGVTHSLYYFIRPIARILILSC
jgi:hypothetical protein